MFNEVSLEKGLRFGVFGVVVEIDGWLVLVFGCDGVLVFMLIGLIVYVFLVGGLVLWFDFEVILVVFNNVYVLFGWLMVISFEVIIVIEIEVDGYDVLVFCDGCCEMLILVGSRFEVICCVMFVKWVWLDSVLFIDWLVCKFWLLVIGWCGK